MYIEPKTLGTLPENKLSQEEFLKLFKDYKNNNDKKAYEELYRHNFLLVYHRIIKRFNSTGIDVDDLVQEGGIGLYKALNTYNINKKTKFISYAITCIDNEILMYIKKNNRHKNQSSLDKIISCESETLDLLDIIKDHSRFSEFVENIESKEMNHKIMKLIKNLPENDRIIISNYFGFFEKERLTQQEIGKILGLTQSAVQRRMTRCLIKLKEQIIVIIFNYFKDNHYNTYKETSRFLNIDKEDIDNVLKKDKKIKYKTKKRYKSE